MPNHTLILRATQVFFVLLGLSCIISGIVVFAVAPVAFAVAILTEVTGLSMLYCAVRANHYINWDKIDAA